MTLRIGSHLLPPRESLALQSILRHTLLCSLTCASCAYALSFKHGPRRVFPLLSPPRSLANSSCHPFTFLRSLVVRQWHCLWHTAMLTHTALPTSVVIVILLDLYGFPSLSSTHLSLLFDALDSSLSARTHGSKMTMLSGARTMRVTHAVCFGWFVAPSSLTFFFSLVPLFLPFSVAFLTAGLHPGGQMVK